MKPLPILLSLVVLTLLVSLVRLVRSYFRLSDIPGPKLARFTNVWRLRAQNSPEYSATLVRLHKRHGKLVRIGPNHVSISDPNAVPIVYTTRPVWDKARAKAASGHSDRRRAYSVLYLLTTSCYPGSILQTSCSSK